MKKVATAIAACLLLTGCVSSNQTVGTAEQVCKSWGTIYPSRKDKLTPGTERQIAGNNAARVPWCGKPQGPPSDTGPELREVPAVEAEKAKRSA